MNPNELLTVSGLAAAFSRDRRTVAAMLLDIPPASEATERGRIIRRYRYADVAAILSAATPADELKASFEKLHAARASLRAFKRQLRTGAALDAEGVKFELSNRIIIARTALLGFCARYGAQLQDVHNETDAKAGRAKLKQILQQGSDEIVAELTAPFTWERTT